MAKKDSLKDAGVNPTEQTVIPTTTNGGEKNTAQPAEISNEPIQQRERQPKSLKEIIEKHQKIARCLEKRQSIDEASKKLDSFHLGSSKIKDTLTIEDGRGNTFETSKTDLIEEVISFLKIVLR